MTTSAPVNLSDHQELAATLVSDLFRTMLARDAWPDSDHEPEQAYTVCGALYFVGAWQGAVLMELDHSLAFSITARLEDVPEPTTVDHYVRDAIGEVTNMLAGNLKTLLPAGTFMSMPSVVEGSDFSLSVIGANRSSQLGFRCNEGPFRITLVEMQDRSVN